MAPVAVIPSSDPASSSISKQINPSTLGLLSPELPFEPSSEPYQRRLRLIQDDPNEPLVSFPLILRPTSPLSTAQLVDAVRPLAPPPSSSYLPSKLQQLMDAHAGAVHFKGLPIRDAQTFSDFMHALAGSSHSHLPAERSNLWTPHVDKGLMVIRFPLAPNVATANEGPPTQSIGSHNEYGLSTHYPSVIAFCCLSAPTKGGQTPIVNSLALHDRLKQRAPGFIEKIQSRGLTFVIHHPRERVQGSVQGNSVFNADSFGPDPQDNVDLTKMGEQEKRQLVEDKVRDLAREGGWDAPRKETGTLNQAGRLGAWQERGFSWTWLPDGSINVFQRVPGIRIHPTLRKPAYFNNIGNRYAYSKQHGCLQPPHYSEEKRDFFPPPAFPNPLGQEEDDEPIPLDWLEEAHRLTEELQAHVEWEVGDVLVIDNLAVQHARTPWEGPRKLIASLWDQRSYLDLNQPIRA